MITEEHNHLFFAFDEIDKDISAMIIQIAENMYDRLISQFELPDSKEKYTLTICPDIKTFMEQSGKAEETYQPWMVGNANRTKRSLCILSPRIVSDRSLEDMLCVVKHEITHIALNALNPKDPDDMSMCLSEGIAVYMAEQIYPNRLDINNFPKVKELDDEKFFYEHDGYNYSGVYIGFLIRKYGTKVFSNIYAETECFDNYLYDGYEIDAIKSFI
ncbi:MAG: hypothetical protein IJL83_01895 [Clostridia bacterium]|nr:hypothetical protein [Clostridia bacterium]